MNSQDYTKDAEVIFISHGSFLGLAQIFSKKLKKLAWILLKNSFLVTIIISKLSKIRESMFWAETDHRTNKRSLAYNNVSSSNIFSTVQKIILLSFGYFRTIAAFYYYVRYGMENFPFLKKKLNAKCFCLFFIN